MVEIRLDDVGSAELYIDGVEIPQYHVSVGVSLYDDQISEASISCYNEDGALWLYPARLRDFPSFVSHIYFNLLDQNNPSQRTFFDLDSNAPRMQFSFVFDGNKWKNVYSIAEFYDEVQNVIDEGSFTCWIDGSDYVDSVQDFLITYCVDTTLTIEQLFVSSSEEVNTIIRRATSNLKSQAESNGSVIQQFDFPEEIRTSCEQYLLYFVQFLKDLGVEADARIEHEAGKVLFSVTPISHQDALDKVREALDVYLRLPGTNAGSTFDFNASVEVQSLTANIQHLNSQLSLAMARIQAQSALVQAKDATIEAKDATIQAHAATIARLTNEDLFVQPDTKKEDDKVELLWGAVAVKTYEGKGIDVNLPLLFTSLQKGFEALKNKVLPHQEHKQLALPSTASQPSDVVEGEIIDEEPQPS